MIFLREYEEKFNDKIKDILVKSTWHYSEILKYTNKDVIELFKNNYFQDDATQTYLIETEKGILGFIRLRGINTDNCLIDVNIAEASRSEKVGSRALLEIQKTVFETYPEISSIEAIGRKDNRAMVKAFLRAGYSTSTNIKSEYQNNGDFYDTIGFALSKSDWLFRNNIKIYASKEEERMEFETGICNADIQLYIKKLWGSEFSIYRGQVYYLKHIKFYVALSQRKIAGILIYCEKDKDVVDLLDLNVKTSSMGLGRSLMALFESERYVSGTKQIRTSMSNADIRAITFFQRYGYNMSGFELNGKRKARSLKKVIPIAADHGISSNHELFFDKRISI